jgi:aspartate/glutamate racemase
MKKIGLVGGMTPESTTAYYQLLINTARCYAEALFSAAAAVA